MVYQIKSNQTEVGCCNKRILQFEGIRFCQRIKEITIDQHRTSQRDKEEEQDNKQNKAQGEENGDHKNTEDVMRIVFNT